VATGHGPCRLCLRTFRVGQEERILFTFDPFDGLEEVPLPGPIFIHAESCSRYPEEGGYPAELRPYPAVIVAYSKGQRVLAQIIAFAVARRHPIVTPCHYVFDGDKKIELHLHRANPLLKAIAESPYVTFSLIAAHVFIPGYWNYAEGSDPAWAAPTSYYAAVQAMGTAQVIADPQAISDLLNRQMKRFQPEGNRHLVEPGDSPFGQMLRSIRGICLTVAEVNVKFKFGGNQNAAHR